MEAAKFIWCIDTAHRDDHLFLYRCVKNKVDDETAGNNGTVLYFYTHNKNCIFFHKRDRSTFRRMYICTKLLTSLLQQFWVNTAYRSATQTIWIRISMDP
jgi:hypothetical protein